MCRGALHNRGSFDAGWSSLVARRAHNPKVVGSNPAPATNWHCRLQRVDSGKTKSPFFRGFFVYGVNKPAVASKDQQITDMLQPTVAALGYTLWGVEYAAQGRHSIVRVYIDNPAGITVEDCAAVSAQVSGVFDVEDPVAGEYTLEVSSPGMDRLLFTLEQYAAYIGEVLELRLRSAFEGRRKFKGMLKGIEGEDVVIQIDDHEFLLPYGSIEKARVHPRV
jgi:ribosome maturation factor RimP